MIEDKPLFEKELAKDVADPDEIPIRDRRLITQPYDMVISALMEQIRSKTIHLRPLLDTPKFQRLYVWSNALASRLIESILLNVPIPPCYFAQDDNFELDVIDGQQRIYSIYRFIENEFALSGLEILKDYKGLRYHKLPPRDQLKLTTHTLRCIVITNDSHPEIRFDVFQRLNTYTVPLNAQELRNCIYRGALVDLLGELSAYAPWLGILGRRNPDNRMRDQELILRFFAFNIKGVDGYRTPQKHWLNEVAEDGQRIADVQIAVYRDLWKKTIDNCLLVFPPDKCFRRLPASKSKVINRALMDLTMDTLSRVSSDKAQEIAEPLRERYSRLFSDNDFLDLISKSVDHTSRTKRRFSIWHDMVTYGLL